MAPTRKGVWCLLSLFVVEDGRAEREAGDGEGRANAGGEASSGESFMLGANAGEGAGASEGFILYVDGGKRDGERAARPVFRTVGVGSCVNDKNRR